MDPEIQALIARAKTEIQLARTASLTIPLGDRAASVGASLYYQYNLSRIKKPYESWMAEAPRVLSDILDVPGSASQKTPLTLIF